MERDVHMVLDTHESATVSEDDAHARILTPEQRVGGPLTVMSIELASCSTDIDPVHTHSLRTLSNAAREYHAEIRHLGVEDQSGLHHSWPNIRTSPGE